MPGERDIPSDTDSDGRDEEFEVKDRPDIAGYMENYYAGYKEELEKEV